MLKQTYDTVTHAMYLQVSEQQVATTVVVSETVYVDLAADGTPVGVEFLNLPTTGPVYLPAEHLDALEGYRFPASALMALGATRLPEPRAAQQLVGAGN